MRENNHKKVMVTGSNGFLGEKLCQTLDQENYHVIQVTRSAINGKNKDLDLSKEIDWKTYLDDIDTVIHTAARVHVIKDNNLDLYDKINTEATINLANQAVLSKVRRFIFISTIKVIGEESFIGKPFVETDDFKNNDSYATSKSNAEIKLMELSKNTSMEIVIIRPPLVYGPKVKANFLLMMKWIEKSIPFPIKKSKNFRSLIYLDNLVDFILLTIKHPLAKNEIFFISDDFDISTVDLMKKINYAMKKKVLFFHCPEKLLSFISKFFRKEGEFKRLKSSLQVDITKAKTLLNWKPKIHFDEAIIRTVNYFNDEKK